MAATIAIVAMAPTITRAIGVIGLAELLLLILHIVPLPTIHRLPPLIDMPIGMGWLIVIIRIKRGDWWHWLILRM